MLADETEIAQLTKRPAVNKTSRFPDLPDAIPKLLPPQRSPPGLQVSKTFGSCFPLSTDSHGPVLRTLASYQTCRRNSHKGAKTAEAERTHGWLTGAGDCIHLFWRSGLHQCRRAPGAASFG